MCKKKEKNGFTLKGFQIKPEPTFMSHNIPVMFISRCCNEQVGIAAIDATRSGRIYAKVEITSSWIQKNDFDACSLYDIRSEEDPNRIAAFRICLYGDNDHKWSVQI